MSEEVKPTTTQEPIKEASPKLMHLEFDVEDYGKISDGNHTFDELYYHRMILFSVICNSNKDIAWKSKKHYDGEMYDNYFVVGITTPNGTYTYHYSIACWKYFEVNELEIAPKWDGHKPEDVVRLISLVPKSEED